MKSIKVSCGQYYGLSFVESNPHKIRKEHTFLFCYFHCKTAPANAVEFFGHRLLSRISILNALNQTETIFSSEKFIHILVCLLSFLPSTFSHPVEVGGLMEREKECESIRHSGAIRNLQLGMSQDNLPDTFKMVRNGGHYLFLLLDSSTKLLGIDWKMQNTKQQLSFSTFSPHSLCAQIQPYHDKVDVPLVRVSFDPELRGVGKRI